MPIQFCDHEDACPALAKAGKILLSHDYSSRGFEVLIKGRDDREYRVFFEYCPFCGTRIDPKYLETLKKRKKA